MVEFAMVLPVLLLILCGIIDFGNILHEYLIITAAAREGARSAAVAGTDAEVEAAVLTAAAVVDRGEIDVTVTPVTRTRGESATVTVVNRVPIVTPLVAALFPESTITVTGQAVMRVE